MGGGAGVVAGLLVGLAFLTGCAAGAPPTPAAAPTAAPPPTVAPPAPTSPPTAPPTALPVGAAARGATAYQAWCNSCHPGGQEANGPALWGQGITFTPAQIRARIRHTTDPRERQRFASLSDGRLEEIIAYIQAQQRAVGSRQ